MMKHSCRRKEWIIIVQNHIYFDLHPHFWCYLDTWWADYVTTVTCNMVLGLWPLFGVGATNTGCSIRNHSTAFYFYPNAFQRMENFNSSKNVPNFYFDMSYWIFLVMCWTFLSFFLVSEIIGLLFCSQ